MPGALTLASVLLYPKTLGGGAVLSGWVPFTSSVINQFPEQAKKVHQLYFMSLFSEFLKSRPCFFFAKCRHQYCGLMVLMMSLCSLKLVKLLFLFLNKPV